GPSRRRTRGAVARARGARFDGRALAGAVVGRPAAARGVGPRAGAPPGADPGRRAHRQPRSSARQAHARPAGRTGSHRGRGLLAGDALRSRGTVGRSPAAPANRRHHRRGRPAVGLGASMTPSLATLIRTLSWAEWRQHPWRHATVLLAVALGV